MTAPVARRYDAYKESRDLSGWVKFRIHWNVLRIKDVGTRQDV